MRKEAAAGAQGFYDTNVWDSLRVAEGSATVALRMAGELGERVRYGAAVTRFEIGRGRCSVALESGETLGAQAFVCAIPVGRLRDIQITGFSDERLASLSRQRHALAAKVVVAYPDSFWLANGRNGLANTEYVA